MKTRFDYQAVLLRVQHSTFCDTGHYYCPRIMEGGVIRFPSGGIVRPDGRFAGPRRLAERIEESLRFPVVEEVECGSHGECPECCPAHGFLASLTFRTVNADGSSDVWAAPPKNS